MRAESRGGNRVGERVWRLRGAAYSAQAGLRGAFPIKARTGRLLRPQSSSRLGALGVRLSMYSSTLGRMLGAAGV